MDDAGDESTSGRDARQEGSRQTGQGGARPKTIKNTPSPGEQSTPIVSQSAVGGVSTSRDTGALLVPPGQALGPAGTSVVPPAFLSTDGAQRPPLDPATLSPYPRRRGPRTEDLLRGSRTEDLLWPEGGVQEFSPQRIQRTARPTVRSRGRGPEDIHPGHVLSHDGQDMCLVCNGSDNGRERPVNGNVNFVPMYNSLPQGGVNSGPVREVVSELQSHSRDALRFSQHMDPDMVNKHMNDKCYSYTEICGELDKCSRSLRRVNESAAPGVNKSMAECLDQINDYVK